MAAVDRGAEPVHQTAGSMPVCAVCNGEQDEGCDDKGDECSDAHAETVSIGP
jgi:hypothetical protein